MFSTLSFHLIETPWLCLDFSCLHSILETLKTASWEQHLAHVIVSFLSSLSCNACFPIFEHHCFIFFSRWDDKFSLCYQFWLETEVEYDSFNILHDKLGGTNKVFLLHTEGQLLSQEKALVQLFAIHGKLSTFFIKFYFGLKE